MRPGDAIPCRQKNLAAIGRASLHRWEASLSGKERAAPHIKTFCKYNADSRELAWVLLTSHNISSSAWGFERQRDAAMVVKSYEIGVLHRPSRCGGARLLSLFHQIDRSGKLPPVAAKDGTTQAQAWPFEVDESLPPIPGPVLYVPLPHVLPAPVYEANDEPWAWDVDHRGEEQLDVFGGQWISGSYVPARW